MWQRTFLFYYCLVFIKQLHFRAYRGKWLRSLSLNIIPLILLIFLAVQVDFRLTFTSKMIFKINLIKIFLLMISILSALIMLNKSLKHFPHKIIMILHKQFFLFLLFTTLIQILNNLLLIRIFKYALHALVILGQWIFRQ